MQLGFVGLGKMGGNMVHRIHRDSDHQVLAYDHNQGNIDAAEGHGATGAASLEDVVAKLDAPGIHYVDVGTSGGVWGLEIGYCMMVGGHEESVQRLAPILDVLAPP